ncbi:MAG TPA: DUF1326 domain-containing protein [Gaiellaceae bacterium]|nr:DUF1326 domain-containing protein [Gaiellaceae bacterium]
MADWHMKGTVLVGCNCDYGCPCNFNAPPSTGDCEGGWVWHIEEGRYEDVDLAGMTLGVFADWPGAIHEGGGKAITVYDERADERQREALEALLRGGEGGPWGIFINTYELLDVKPAQIELEVDGEHSSYRIGDIAELVMEPIKNPVSGAEVRSGVVLPTGLVFSEGWCAASTTFRVSDDVAYDHSGKQAEYAPFEYSGS